MIRYEPLGRKLDIEPDAGMQGRRKLSRKFRMFLYDARHGRCFYCGEAVDRKNFQVVHDEAVAFRGNDKMSNKHIAHPEPCHSEHTKKENPIIARCDKIGRKHRGEHKPRHPMQCGKKSKWKRTIDGRTVRR